MAAKLSPRILDRGRLKGLTSCGLALLLFGCVSGHGGGGGKPIANQSGKEAVSPSNSRNLGTPLRTNQGMVPLLVRTVPSVSAAEGRLLFKNLNCQVIQQIHSSQGILWGLDAPEKEKDELVWISFLQKQSGIQSVEVDLTRKLAVPLE